MWTYHDGAVRRQFRYDPHRTLLTARTARDILLRYPLHERFRSFERQWRRRGDLKRLAGLGQTVAFVSWRQQPIVANPLEARWQDMLQETADEHGPRESEPPAFLQTGHTNMNLGFSEPDVRNEPKYVNNILHTAL
jgi:hypothetical protein